MTKTSWTRALAGLCGIAGPVILVASLAMNPSPPPGLAPTALAAWAEPRAGFIVLDGGMQGFGSLLTVIFALALVRLSGAAHGFMGWLTRFAGGTILMISLIEVTFYLTAAQAIASGDTASDLISDGLDRAVQHVFLTVPALLLPLAVVLLRTRVLARPFAWSGLAIGAGLQVLALAGAFRAMQPAVDALVILQSAWFVAAGAALALSAPKLRGVAHPSHNDDLKSAATTPTEECPGDAIDHGLLGLGLFGAA
jgi:hypothetical protein